MNQLPPPRRPEAAASSTLRRRPESRTVGGDIRGIVSGEPPASVQALIDGDGRQKCNGDDDDGDGRSVETPPVDAASHRAMVEAMLSECVSSDSDSVSDEGSESSMLYRSWGAGTEDGEAEYDYCLSTREGVVGLLTFLSEMAADAEDGGINAKTAGGKRFMRRRRRRRLAAALIAFGAFCFLLGFLTCAAVVALSAGPRGGTDASSGCSDIARDRTFVDGYVSSTNSTQGEVGRPGTFSSASPDPTEVIDIDASSRPVAGTSNVSQAQEAEGAHNTTGSEKSGEYNEDIDGEYTNVNVTSDALYVTDKTMQISRTNRLLFVHVPSAGGSAVERSSLFDDARSHHAIGGNWPIKDMVRGSEGRGLTDEFVRAALIRHPCERFVASFGYVKDHGNSKDREWSREHIGNRTIGEFLAYLEEAEGKEAGKEPHFRTTEHFLFLPSGKLGVDTLLCAERWDESMDRLAGAIGRPVPRDLYTGAEDGIRRFPADPTHEIGNSQADGCSHLDAEVREMIEARYAIDYCVFGYPRGPDAVAPEGCGEEPPEVYTKRYKECRASSS